MGSSLQVRVDGGEVVSRRRSTIKEEWWCIWASRRRIRVYMMNKLKQYERLFKQFDENGDGKISACELKQCVEAMGEELSAEDAAASVTLLDADGDGLVGFDDFVRFVEGGKEEEKENDLREAFKMYEMDESGCITPRSLKRMLSRLGESTTIDECQLMIARFDLDGDGVLTFHEFKVMML
ncbi:putative calcium-binding protein [Vigna angularis]|nr:putative calcium-binding protein [Vigna angularis]